MKEDVRRFLPQLLAMPRHKKGWCKPQLREFLREPIKAFHIDDPESLEGRQEIVRMHREREEALFALYDIDNDWPIEIQWQQLALRLAGEHFPGCRTLQRGYGGPTEETQVKKKGLKATLFGEFEAFKSKFEGTESAAARVFLNRNRKRCQEAGLSNPKSFLQAMKATAEKASTETEALGS